MEEVSNKKFIMTMIEDSRCTPIYRIKKRNESGEYEMIHNTYDEEAAHRYFERLANPTIKPTPKPESVIRESDI